jgi:GAF domain-containing protein
VRNRPLWTTPITSVVRPTVDGMQRGQRHRTALDVALPVIAAAAPTAMFQLPGLVLAPPLKAVLIAVGLLVLVGVVAFQVVRGRRAIAAQDDVVAAVEQAVGETESANQFAYGQIATRLARLADLSSDERASELGSFADRVATTLAFFLLRGIPDARANVYAITPGADALEPIGHGGARDTGGTFRAGTPFGDRNLDWVVACGPPRVVDDWDVDAAAADRRDGFAPRYRSYASVVIRVGDRSFGMLTVDSATRSAFDTAELEAIEIMATYMAVGFVLCRRSPDEIADTRREETLPWPR